MPDATPGLFSPFRAKGLRLSNRIVVSPMAQYRAVDGCLTDWHLMHLGQFAKSGAGLLITEAMHVSPEGRITPACAGLYNDAQEAALRRVLDFCRQNGRARLGVQIDHAGRKGSAHPPAAARNRPLTKAEGGWPSVSCSGLPYGEGWPRGRIATADDLARITQAHADAAARAARAGADYLEVVMAHGYLLHEFLSPLSNQRDDAFGGALENRLRFPLQVFAAVRAAWPEDRPLAVRLSVEDHLPGGWDLAASLELCRHLRELGCDIVCASSGGLSLAQKVNVFEGHQVHYAQAIRAETGLTAMTVGMIENPNFANQIISDGQADLVAIARAYLHDPHWPWYAAATLDEDIEFPPEYIRAYRSRWLRKRRAQRGGRAAVEAGHVGSPFGSTAFEDEGNR